MDFETVGKDNDYCHCVRLLKSEVIIPVVISQQKGKLYIPKQSKLQKLPDNPIFKSSWVSTDSLKTCNLVLKIIQILLLYLLNSSIQIMLKDRVTYNSTMNSMKLQKRAGMVARLHPFRPPTRPSAEDRGSCY